MQVSNLTETTVVRVLKSFSFSSWTIRAYDRAHRRELEPEHQ
ncbi:hypothetical protein CEV34_3156 [Brucella pseudogrignonensis]|uniref:Uncharacterized protein n=1 Tax=Brucella pseudogrignonensis TaxID=419475 RepID=A0A256GA94_9HYPH|nr:hypothetical protein CEV34_3156 [Brucella pseudogrignonensis]